MVTVGVLPVGVGSDGRNATGFRLVRDVYRSPCVTATLLRMDGADPRCCGVARAVELLDERWTMLVVRELVGICVAGPVEVIVVLGVFLRDGDAFESFCASKAQA